MDEAESAATLAEAEERVRRSIARALHDDVQQHLHSLRVRIGLLEARVVRGDDVDAEALADLGRRADDAVAALRGAVATIAEPTQPGDLSEALRAVAARTVDLHGLRIDVDVEPRVAAASPEGDRLMVEAARELLFNVVKHAGDDHARLRLYADSDMLVLEVSDAGHNAEAFGPDGFGRRDLRQRAATVGGSLHVTHPDRGTTVTLRIPLDVNPGRSSD